MSMREQSKILLDVGSSTVKAYKVLPKPNGVELFLHRSIPFKKEFDSEKGISEDNKKEFFELIDVIKEKNKEAEIRVYATAIFRKLSATARVAFVDEFFRRTGLFFNVVSQDLENFYLEVALMGKCSLEQPVLLMNIGGASTELVVMYGREAIERQGIDFGVGTIISEFSGINESVSQKKIEEVIQFAKSQLPELSNNPKISSYTGGELNYMKLAQYPVVKNNLFSDNDHPVLISIKDFSERNKDIFEKVTLQELESLMPENPKWMHGARGCSAIAQAICEKYSLEIIVPSNSNTINGVARQEFRYVTISGSFRKHLDYILKVKKELEQRGVKILSPRFVEPQSPGEEFVVFAGEEGMTPLELERHHLDSIARSDALVVCDPSGYVGASALIEIGYANALGKRIIFVEKPEEFMLNTLPAEVGL